MNNNTQQIANFVAGLHRRSLPPEVSNAARLCLADWLGVAMGALGEPAGRAVYDACAGTIGRGRSTLLAGGRADALTAALCNGTLAHCLDFDDTYVKANTHTSGPVWAATLALGEELGASEQDMLHAFVAGFEASARAGYGLGEAITARGWHCTGIFGRIGAAAAAAALFRLDTEKTLNALGAAATQAAGLTVSFGTMAKPFHAGKAAMDGVLAAQLAKNGFEAAQNVLEPGGGLDRALIQDGSVRICPADFSGWEILQNSFKPYAACHLTHPAIEAARAARSASPGITSVRNISVEVGELAMQVTGGKSGEPLTSLEAKFDLKYVVALALHGRSLSAADFRSPLRVEPDVIATARRVRVAAGSGLGYASARLFAELAGAQPLRVEIPVAKGHPGNPIGWDDMQEKFFGLVDPDKHSLLDRVRSFGTSSTSGLMEAAAASASVS